MKGRKIIAALWSGFFAVVCFMPTVLYAQADFYQGKTLTIVQGRDAGGTGDLRVRALVPFLQKYIRGNPTIVMEYMAGGGGRKAANYLYRTARPDGLTIGNPSVGMFANAILGESGVQYDIDKFSYLGSPYSTYHAVFVSRKEAGFDSIEKLRAATGVRIGAQSVGFVTYNEGRLFAYILGLKEPRFIAAYSAPGIRHFLKSTKNLPAMNLHRSCRKRMKRRSSRFHANTRLSKCQENSRRRRSTAALIGTFRLRILSGAGAGTVSICPPRTIPDCGYCGSCCRSATSLPLLCDKVSLIEPSCLLL